MSPDDRLRLITARGHILRAKQRRPQPLRLATPGPRNAPVRAAIAAVLTASPTSSDREIGRRVGCDQHVVADVRAQLGIAPRPRGRRTDVERNAAIVAAALGGVSFRAIGAEHGVCRSRAHQIALAAGVARSRAA